MPITLPFTFTNGTVADAIQVNANFSELTRAVGGVAGGSLVVGGGLPPSPAPGAGSLISNTVSVRPDAAPSEPIARLCLNCYLDASGALRYLDNGPASTMTVRAAGPSGPGSRVAFQVADINSAGPSALCTPAGALNLVYGPVGGGNTNAYVLVGDGTHVPTTFQPPLNSLVVYEIFSARLCLSLTPGPTGLLAGRLNMNSYADITNTVRYLANGFAYNIVGHNDAGGLDFNWGASATAGATVTFEKILTLRAPPDTPAEQTNMLILTNKGGTINTTDPVMLGPVGSGPGGNGRALYVAN